MTQECAPVFEAVAMGVEGVLPLPRAMQVSVILGVQCSHCPPRLFPQFNLPLYFPAASVIPGYRV